MSKKILIVDDESTMQHLLKNLLRKEGYTTLTAANGQEAIDVLKSEKVDLILLDINMSIMDGFEFFKQVKANHATEHIPVFVLTVRKKMEDSFMALGADAFFGKPFNREKLLSEIKSVLDHAQQERIEVETNQLDQEISGPVIASSSGINQASVFSTTDKTGTPEEIKFQKKQVKNVLVAGTVDNVTNYMAEVLKRQGCEVQIAVTGKEVEAKALEWKPEIILLEINMDGLTAPEIINNIKTNGILNTQILLYSIFVTQEAKKNSIVNTYYANRFKHEPEGPATEEEPVYYFGAFQKRSFMTKITKFLSCGI